MNNSKKRIIISILLVVAIVIIWTVVPAVNSTAQAQGGALYTTLVAQNMDAFNTMNARVMYSNLTGSPVLTTTHTIQPYRALAVNQQNQPRSAYIFHRLRDP